jgi:hypothetical protein
MNWRSVFMLTMFVVTALLTACAPSPEADDEGHATFARHSIRLLLGRPARGVDEVKVVADVANLLGRDVALKMLMKQTEFVDTWADNLVDLLQIQRGFGAGLPAQDQTCWGPPTRPTPDPEIATWVRDHGPNDGGAPPAWNMTDLLRSAIAIDDLSPVYRAYLFTLSMRRTSYEPENTLKEVTERFMRTYLNRDLACLRCHNPTFSASNRTDNAGNIVWQRTWTIPGHPEKALFGNYFDAATAINGLRKVMGAEVRRPAGGPAGIRPWGIQRECAIDSDDPSPANSGPPKSDGFQIVTGTNPGAVFGSIDGSTSPASLFELEAALRVGINDLRDGYARFPPSSVILPPEQKLYCDAATVFASKCASCHSSQEPDGELDLATRDPASQLINVDTVARPQPPNLQKRVVPNDTAHSELWRRIENDIMPPGAPLPTFPPGAERLALKNWISNGAPHTPDTSVCNTSTIPDVHPNEALAFLTAANLVDGIWMAAMGYRLTIDNGFSRNSQQRDMLWTLTEYEFLPKNWSLKAVLTSILASNWYARRAPVISQESSAYSLPPILDPWIVADPAQVTNPPDHERFNGQGELVDRFRVNTLLRSIGAALAWRGPPRFPGFDYPSPLSEDLGQYVSPQIPGFRGVNFQSLLALESQVGLCDKTDRAIGVDDWLDKLVEGIAAYNAANPNAPITMGEAWSMLKDRLIQDTSINAVLPSGLATVPSAKTEQQAVVAFLNVGLSVPGGITLNTSTGVVTARQLGEKLRAACGVLVKSPQFLLTNVTPRSYSDTTMPALPRLSVCMPGEPCGYAQICESWRRTIQNMGHTISCTDRGLQKSLWIAFRNPEDLMVSAVDAKRALQAWSVLARRAGAETTALFLGPSAGQVTTTHGRELDLIKNVIVAGSQEAATGLFRVHQRVATLCPGGLCGFFERPRSAQQRCLASPEGSGCRTLRAACDPRGQRGSIGCGRLPADFTESGVLALWGDGAEVRSAAGARILRQDGEQWRPLEVGAKLRTGDLVYLPLDGSVRLQADDVVFGDEAMNETEVLGVQGHLLAITGPAAQSMLSQSPKRGAMSLEQLRTGSEAGAFNSRPMTGDNLDRALGYAISPHHKRTLTPKEIVELNRNFEALHRGIPAKKK